MANENKNVRVAVTGAVYVGPTDTEAPTDALSAVPTGLNDLGYVSEEGVTETRERSTNQIRAWQKGALVREVTTESSMQFSFRLIETKKETVELFYGSSVEADGSIKIKPSESGGRQSFVLDIVDGDEEIRVYVKDAELAEVGDVVYANGEAIGYEVTLTAYPDADGVAAVKWMAALDTTAGV